MNVHIGYRLPRTPVLDKEIQRQIEKLRTRLHVFRPELIHLKGMIEDSSARKGASVSLNLRLPSGQMAAHCQAATPVAAMKIAFDDLLQQLGKHKELLRSTHQWPRRQLEAGARHNASVPFEQTLAAVFPVAISADDVRSYVNANLSRLERFVEREIYFREASGLIAPDSIGTNEVIDETIAAALSDESAGEVPEKPERLALEPWLYRLAIRALNQLSRANETGVNAVPLEDLAGRDKEMAGGPPVESFISNGRTATPEQIVGSDEILQLVASALQDLKPAHREAFILHAIEGFAIDEISAITGAPPQHIQHAIAAARDHLRQSPGVRGFFKGRSPKAKVA